MECNRDASTLRNCAGNFAWPIKKKKRRCASVSVCLCVFHPPVCVSAKVLIAQHHTCRPCVQSVRSVQRLAGATSANHAVQSNPFPRIHPLPRRIFTGSDRTMTESD
ncbi:hypothetical protein ZHAS_00016215 [Anopheles sinensis]|uniref:Uncharacterized protein n=1 Tax=Anopheles sinensis TaxID=74873 RepID=A0A084WD57_ANOSI|nr:hypothetical protein ZHAS_00016215 [Anopheles sinensis]